jgi:hypothetical protein
VPFGKLHARRLREIYRSAGWPCCDGIEVELLAGGFLERVRTAHGHETLRVTDAGIARIATTLTLNRAALSPHEALVERVAREMTRGGRIAWRGLGLRARLPALEDGERERGGGRGRQAALVHRAARCVFDPQHQRRGLCAPHRPRGEGEPRRPAGRPAQARQARGLPRPGRRVLVRAGQRRAGRCIATPEEVPAECGVMVLEGERLVVARAAVHRAVRAHSVRRVAGAGQGAAHCGLRRRRAGHADLIGNGRAQVTAS